MTSPNYRKNI